MKRKTAVFFALVMLCSAFASCGGANDEKTIRIGVFEPASGDNGAGGKQETLGVQYANSKVNTVDINGETYKVELVIVDNESSNSKAPSAASSLVSKGVSVVLGSYGSGVSIAASDIFKEAGIPVIGITCTNPQVTEGNSHYFRICFLDPFQGMVLSSFAVDKFKAKKAYCLAKLGDDYSVGLVNYFIQSFEAAGGTVVSETFPEGNTDFSAYITRARSEGCDIFFSPVSTEAAVLIIEQSDSLGSAIPILAGDTWDSNVVTAAAKGKNVEVYITAFYQEGGAPDFDAGFKAWVESSPANLAANNGNSMIAAVSVMGYDAYFVALEAVKAAASTDPVKINEALWNVRYTGVSGLIEFDKTGDAMRDVAYIKRIDNITGDWLFISVQGIE